jgi:hypothetical protein
MQEFLATKTAKGHKGAWMQEKYVVVFNCWSFVRGLTKLQQ